MLFQQRFLDGIRDGSITLAFRRWQRPSVRAGGTLLTPVGQLTITSLSKVALRDISKADARRAGYESLDELHAALHDRTRGEIYRIELGSLRPDPRIALRKAATLTAEETRDLITRLQRLDDHAPRPWTLRTLELIRSRPGVRWRLMPCAPSGQGHLQTERQKVEGPWPDRKPRGRLQAVATRARVPAQNLAVIPTRTMRGVRMRVGRPHWLPICSVCSNT
jgi:hypothetical protein